MKWRTWLNKNGIGAIVFSVGLITLLLEILGTRIIAPFYGSTIFVWASLITVSLGGLALGYWYGGIYADRIMLAPLRVGKYRIGSIKDLLSVVLAAAGVYLMLVVKVDDIVLLITDFLGVRFGPLMSAVALFIAPFTLLGSVTPIAIRYRVDEIAHVSSDTGRLFAYGTIGSVAGALLAGFILVPLLAVSTVFTLAGAVLCIFAIGFYFEKRDLDIALVSSSAVLLLFLIPSYLTPAPVDAQVIYKNQGFSGDIKIYELGGENRDIRCLLIDTSNQSCWNYDQNASAWPYTRYFRGAVNFFPEDKEINILIIGLGGGSVVKELAQSERPMHIDVVEIDPRVLEATREWIGLPDDDRITYHISDGRYFLNHVDKKYHLIMTDIVIGTDVALHLSTKEFFEEVNRKLYPGGVFGVNAKGWVYEQTLQPLVYKTLESVFPYVHFSARKPEIVSTIVYFARQEPFNERMFKGMIPNFYDKSVWDDVYEYEKISVMTDNYNPSHILDLPVVEYGRNQTVDLFGHELYLYEPKNN